MGLFLQIMEEEDELGNTPEHQTIQQGVGVAKPLRPNSTIHHRKSQTGFEEEGGGDV